MLVRFPRLSDADKPFRRLRVERRLTQFLPAASEFARVSLVSAPSNGPDYCFIMRKEGRRLVLAFEHRRILRDDALVGIFHTRPGILIEGFARTCPAVTEAAAEVSDGSNSGPGIVSFCSVHRDAILVPDSDFYASQGYASFRVPAGGGVPWRERDARIVWRGSSTGRGRITSEAMRADEAQLIQRTRLCLAARSLQNVDAKLINVVQSDAAAPDLARFAPPAFSATLSIRFHGASEDSRWM